ncbi:MAG: putative glycoside hydrolase, partial [Actinomycetota bacterium]
MRQSVLWRAGAVLAMVCAACGGQDADDAAAPTPTALPTATAAPAPAATATPVPTPTPTPVPVEVSGVVRSSVDGAPVAAAVVQAGGVAVTTGVDGGFTLRVGADVETVDVTRPVWQAASAVIPDDGVALEIELDPVIVRGLRVSQQVAADDEAFAELLALADATTVNTLVFDTKDEADLVLYETDVAFAHEIDGVGPVYDPVQRIAQARERGLYTVTRIVTFEDPVWSRAAPDAGLAGHWVDAADPANWEYPLALAEEACAIGFDEVQFDYVRFPSGETAARAASLVPPTEEERSAAIAGFLGSARDILHPMGCG